MRPDLQDDQLNPIIFALRCDGLETVGIQTTVAVGDQDDLASVGQLLRDSLYHVNRNDQGRDSCLGVSTPKPVLDSVNVPSPTSVLLGTSCCLSRRTSGINALRNMLSRAI
jgi:hypothetical protein